MTDQHEFELNTDLVLGIAIIVVGLLLAGLVAHQNGQFEWVKRQIEKYRGSS